MNDIVSRETSLPAGVGIEPGGVGWGFPEDVQYLGGVEGCFPPSPNWYANFSTRLINRMKFQSLINVLRCNYVHASVSRG